jgi:hypothetical protein
MKKSLAFCCTFYFFSIKSNFLVSKSKSSIAIGFCLDTANLAISLGASDIIANL